MNTRTKISLLTALLLTAPVLTHAGADVASDTAMDACVKSFVSTHLENEQPVTVRAAGFAASKLAQQSRAYRISMKAVDNYSGKQVAKATCVVDRSGVVLSMNRKPVAMPVLTQTPAVLSSR